MSHRTDAKNAERLYQYWSAQIMREARDETTLSAIGNRALANHDVAADPMLRSRIQACISDRARELRVRRQQAEVDARRRDAAPEATRVTTRPVRPYLSPPTHEELVHRFERLRHDFDLHVRMYDLRGAGAALKRIEALRAQHTDDISPACIERCRLDLERLKRECDSWSRHIRALAEQAISAARCGDERTATWVVRRLSVLHSLYPELLGEDDFAALRERIVTACDAHEDQETAKALLRRERAVADEIRALARGVHEFHNVAQRAAHDTPEYQAAEREFERVIQAVRSHDTDWLAGLILEFEALVDEMHDPAGRAQQQVDNFLNAVRASLNRLRQQVNKIQRESRRKPA